MTANDTPTTTITINLGAAPGAEVQLDDLTTEQLLERGSRLDDMLEAMTAEVIAPIKEQLDTVKDLLRVRALAVGTTLSGPAGRVEFIKAGERVTWNDRALLALVAAIAESQPDTAAAIMGCRETTPVQPSARVRFAVKG
jgi:hypothetical protein